MALRTVEEAPPYETVTAALPPDGKSVDYDFLLLKPLIERLEGRERRCFGELFLLHIALSLPFTRRK